MLPEPAREITWCPQPSSVQGMGSPSGSWATVWPMQMFPDLIRAYLTFLEGRASWPVMQRVAKPWVLTLDRTPTRTEILARMGALCTGHFQPNATKANKELKLIRAACNWGRYHECWPHGNPTDGIRLFQTPRRTRIARLEELSRILRAFDRAQGRVAQRDRTLFAVQLFTGCRPSEARRMGPASIRPYGTMGCWTKGRTKNGQSQELPLPRQVMVWLQELPQTGTYYFSRNGLAPLHEATVRHHWTHFCRSLGVIGVWNYDLRRTLAHYLRKILKQDDGMIQSILNHYDGRALAHYLHADFDDVAAVIQGYADWLLTLPTGPTTSAFWRPHAYTLPLTL